MYRLQNVFLIMQEFFDDAAKSAFSSLQSLGLGSILQTYPDLWNSFHQRDPAPSNLKFAAFNPIPVELWNDVNCRGQAIMARIEFLPQI